MIWLIGALVLVLALLTWRALDRAADTRVWRALLARTQPRGSFDPASLAGLPEPARRFFAYMIRPGAPLVTAAEIEMKGEIGLGDKADPKYQPMTARQLLAPPYGLVWRVTAGAIAGSDAAIAETSWTRFWLFGLLPVVRASGADHARSAFGRVVAEAAFWAPASLLPSDHVRWEALDETSARAIVTFGPYQQSVDILVDDQGQLQRVVIARWSNANAQKAFREQPFGGFVSDFREVEGYRLPYRVEGGNLIGSDDYFPFYKAEVQRIRFPHLGAPARPEVSL